MLDSGDASSVGHTPNFNIVLAVIINYCFHGFDTYLYFHYISWRVLQTLINSEAQCHDAGISNSVQKLLEMVGLLTFGRLALRQMCFLSTFWSICFSVSSFIPAPRVVFYLIGLPLLSISPSIFQTLPEFLNNVFNNLYLNSHHPLICTKGSEYRELVWKPLSISLLSLSPCMCISWSCL